MPPTDAALLTAYARDRDEVAFGQLAERHFALIYHTALRRTGRHVLAQEVSQNVLCLLARKAAPLLLKADRLPAWLHRATVFEAAKAMRQEDTSHRRAQLQHPDDIAETAATPEPALWENCLPLLDEALDSLPESDRQVLTLHYLENLSFPRIAVLSGKPAATLQKQSVRALAKLSNVLARKLQVSGGSRLRLSAAIVAGMSAEAAKAAPASLIPAMTHTAVTAASAPTLLTKLILMSATHSKAILGGTLLLLALPLGLQQLAIARTRSELAGFSSTTSLISSRSRPVANVVPASSAADSELFQLSEEAITAGNVEPVRLKLRKHFEAMSFAELLHLLDQIDASSLGQSRREILKENVGPILVARDPMAGMTAVADRHLLDSMWAHSAYSIWLKRDSLSAAKWLQGALVQGASPEQRKPLVSYLGEMTRQMVATDPTVMNGLLDLLSPAETIEVLNSALPGNPSSSLDHLPDEAEALGWLEILRQRIPAEDRERMLGDFGMMYYKGSGFPSFEHLKPLSRIDLSLNERRVIATAVSERAMTGHGTSPPRDLSTGMREWLEAFIPEEAGAIASAGQEATDRQRDEEQLDALNYLQGATTLSDSDLVRALSGSDFGRHMDLALIVASHIKDPEKRAAIEAEIRKGK